MSLEERRLPNPCPWVNLPEDAQQMAQQVFAIGRIPIGQGKHMRAAQIRENGSLILDPVAVSENPEAPFHVGAAGVAPIYHIWRTRQLLAHLDAGTVQWGLKRNQFQGRPAYIVGNGPSAGLARDLLPHRGGRHGIVFAVNGAASLFPGDHDFWCLACALWPHEEFDWYESLLEEWRGFDHCGAEALCTLYANRTAVLQFRHQGGQGVHHYNGAHNNPYWDFLPRGAVPAFVEGMEATLQIMHVAWWLGCSPIVLFGVDQGRFPGQDGDHSSRVGWRPADNDILDYSPEIGVGGRPIETSPRFMVSSLHISAMSMWLLDAGCPVYSASRGLELSFTYALEENDQARDLIQRLEQKPPLDPATEPG